MTTRTAPLLKVGDLGLLRKSEQSKGDLIVPEDQDHISAPGKLFDDQAIGFDYLRGFELDLDIMFDEIEGVHFKIDSVEGKIRLIGGVMRIDPFRLNFVSGRTDIRTTIDVRKEIPVVQVWLESDDVDLGAIFGQLDRDPPLEGELDLLIELATRGETPHEMAKSLNGEIGIAIERGRINTSYVGLAALGLVDWLFAESTRQGYSKIDCFLASFAVAEGIADVQALLLDTPEILAHGKGKVDLGEETIRLDFETRSRRGRAVDLGSSVSVTGSLKNPLLEVDSGGAAARATARTMSDIIHSPIYTLAGDVPVDVEKLR